MKKSIVCILFVMLGACVTSPKGDKSTSTSGTPSGFDSAKDYYDLVPGARNFGAAIHTINQKLSADASANRKIYLEAGTYELEKDLVGGKNGINSDNATTGINGFRFVDDLTLVGDATEPTIIEYKGTSPAYIILDGGQNITISNIVFKNIHVYVRSRNNSSVKAENITFAGNIFYGSQFDGTSADNSPKIGSSDSMHDPHNDTGGSYILQFNIGAYSATGGYGVDNLTLTHNIFLKDNSQISKYSTGGYAIGRAVGIYGVQNSTISNNIIGMDVANISTLSSRFAGDKVLVNTLNKISKLNITGKQSFYGSAIQHNTRGAAGTNGQILIANNHIQGIFDSTSTAQYAQIDMAIRLVDAKNYAILGNYFSGWGKDTGRPTIYLQDAEDTLIANNFFNNGHIFLERRASGTATMKLNNVWIDGNYFNVNATPSTGTEYKYFSSEVKGDLSGITDVVLNKNTFSKESYATDHEVGVLTPSDTVTQKLIFANNSSFLKVFEGTRTTATAKTPTAGTLPTKTPFKYADRSSYPVPK